MELTTDEYRLILAGLSQLALQYEDVSGQFGVIRDGSANMMKRKAHECEQLAEKISVDLFESGVMT